MNIVKRDPFRTIAAAATQTQPLSRAFDQRDPTQDARDAAAVKAGVGPEQPHYVLEASRGSGWPTVSTDGRTLDDVVAAFRALLGDGYAEFRVSPERVPRRVALDAVHSGHRERS